MNFSEFNSLESFKPIDNSNLSNNPNNPNNPNKNTNVSNNLSNQKIDTILTDNSNSNSNNNNNNNNSNNNNNLNETLNIPSFRPIPPLYNNNNNKLSDSEPENNNDTSQNKIKLVNLGIIITLSLFSAIAWNEAIKYYIGRSIKFYNGQPVYYIYYAISVSVLTFFYYLNIFLK